MIKPLKDTQSENLAKLDNLINEQDKPEKLSRNASGILKGRFGIDGVVYEDGVAYQRKLRDEWE